MNQVHKVVLAVSLAGLTALIFLLTVRQIRFDDQQALATEQLGETPRVPAAVRVHLPMAGTLRMMASPDEAPVGGFIEEIQWGALYGHRRSLEIAVSIAGEGFGAVQLNKVDWFTLTLGTRGKVVMPLLHRPEDTEHGFITGTRAMLPIEGKLRFGLSQVDMGDAPFTLEFDGRTMAIALPK